MTGGQALERACPRALSGHFWRKDRKKRQTVRREWLCGMQRLRERISIILSTGFSFTAFWDGDVYKRQLYDFYLRIQAFDYRVEKLAEEKRQHLMDLSLIHI